MFKQSILSKIYSWLYSPEVFGSVAKKIPGSWQLFEYYRDTEGELVHILESDLSQSNEALLIDFLPQNEFCLTAKMPVPIFPPERKGVWSVNRNFITLVDAKDFRNNIEFQFAFEKGNFKLLKKDRFGKIEFFGFFKPQKSKS